MIRLPRVHCTGRLRGGIGSISQQAWKERARNGRLFWPIGALVVGGGFLLGGVELLSGHRLVADTFGGPGGSELRAASRATVDSDGDGLFDVQESVLGTDPDEPDTDGDGFIDVQEIAQQSDPRDASSFPDASSPRVGLTARTGGGDLFVVSAVHVPGGQYAGLNVSFGLGLDGVATPIPTAVYLPSTLISAIPSAQGNDAILVLETLVPESYVHYFGQLQFYATETTPGAGTTVGTLDLVSVDGEVMSIQSSPASIQSGGGVVYRPLGGGDGLPAGWTSGQICWQQTSPVGVNGSSIVYEVDAASCEQTDTYCSGPSCFAKVGGTVELLDPGALVGG